MKNHSHRYALLLSTAVTAVAGILEAAPAFAQTAANDAAAQTSTGLQEIVVTAQKRTERLQDVPVSITALDSGSLARQNLVSLQDYASRVPGLNYSGTQQSQIAIRGITTGGTGINPTVAILVDDVPFGSSTAFPLANTLDLDPADIRQVEVLRGPQGTLYGASNLGGLIKYTTIQPNTSDYSGTMQLDGNNATNGGYGYGARGTLNVPLANDVAAVRVSGFYRKDPSVGFNALTNDDRANTSRAYGGRAALLLRPVERLTLDFSALYQKLRRFGNAGGARVQEYVDANYKPQFGPLGTNNLPQPSFEKVQLYTGRAVYDLDFATATSITSYSKYRGQDNSDLTQLFAGAIPFFSVIGVNFPPTNRLVLDAGHQTNKWTEEFRLASKDNQPLEWLVGFFYTHEKSDNPQDIDSVGTGSPDNIYSGHRYSKYEEYAGFADLTYHFTPKFDVQVGARYAHNSQDFTSVATGRLELLLSGFTTNNLVVDGTSKEGAWTWLVTPRYRFSRDLMVYARVATGYRPGGPNLPQPGISNTFNSDKTTNYEAGIKGELMDHKVRFDADAFWIDWKNIQLLTINPATALAYTSNGSAARSRGFEASVDVKPLPGLTLGANGAYIDAELTSGLPGSGGANPAAYGVSGDRLPFSAHWTGNLNAEQEFNLDTHTSFYVGGNLSLVGRRLADFTNSAAAPRVVLSSYRQLDLRAGIRRDGYGLNFFVKNLSNSRGAFSGAYQTNYIPVNGYQLSLINPRTIGINVTAAF